MGKPTVHDIAKAAGVSLATIDRVLNSRPGVRENTVERVNTAISKLGYIRDISAANLARQREYRFEFILPDSASRFVASLTGAIGEAGINQTFVRTNIKISTVPENDPHAVSRALDALDRSNVDGVAIMAPETPQLRDAIGRLRSEGISVVALVSDLPNSKIEHFVGINNIAAGRTSAVLMGRFSAARSGEILVVANSMQSRDSLERRLGFDGLIAEEFPALNVLPSLETHGDTVRTRQIVSTALAAHPQICGIYVLGSGIQSLVETLSEFGCKNEVVVLAHELTSFTRNALCQGLVDAVITQDVGHLARSSLRVLRANTDGSATIPSQERIRIEVILKENLP